MTYDPRWNLFDQIFDQDTKVTVDDSTKTVEVYSDGSAIGTFDTTGLSLITGISVSAFSNENIFTNNSDTVVPTQTSSKNYTDDWGANNLINTLGKDLVNGSFYGAVDSYKFQRRNPAYEQKGLIESPYYTAGYIMDFIPLNNGNVATFHSVEDFGSTTEIYMKVSSPDGTTVVNTTIFTGDTTNTHYINYINTSTDGSILISLYDSVTNIPYILSVSQDASIILPKTSITPGVIQFPYIYSTNKFLLFSADFSGNFYKGIYEIKDGELVTHKALESFTFGVTSIQASAQTGFSTLSNGDIIFSGYDQYQAGDKNGYLIFDRLGNLKLDFTTFSCPFTNAASSTIELPNGNCAILCCEGAFSGGTNGFGYLIIDNQGEVIKEYQEIDDQGTKCKEISGELADDGKIIITMQQTDPGDNGNKKLTYYVLDQNFNILEGPTDITSYIAENFGYGKLMPGGGLSFLTIKHLDYVNVMVLEGTGTKIDGYLDLESGASVNEFSTDISISGNSDEAVPTSKAVKTYVDNALITSLEVRYIYSDTTAVANEVLLVDTTAGAVSVEMIGSDDAKIYVKKITGDGNVVTITVDGGQVDGSENIQLASKNDSYIFVSDGTNFFTF